MPQTGVSPDELDLETFTLEMVKEDGCLSFSKYKLSKEANGKGDNRLCPVTVSETVDSYLTQELTDQKLEPDDHKKIELFRTKLILSYLLFPVREPIIWYDGDNPFASEQCGSRLEGELRRFGADLHLTDPRRIIIDKGLVDRYCQRSDVQGLRELIMYTMAVRE